MTREQLINEAVAKALWESLEGGPVFKISEHILIRPDFAGEFGITDIHRYLFPHIEKLGLWEAFGEALSWVVGTPTHPNSTNKGIKIIALATPLQICEAFLRATGAWTKEMEA